MTHNNLLNLVVWNLFTWSAAVIFTTAFWLYNKAVVFKGQATGPFSTWGPNALIATVSCWIYIPLTIHFVNALVYCVDAFLSSVVAVVVLIRLIKKVRAKWESDKKSRSVWWEYSYSLGSVTALVVWRIYPAAHVGYVMNLIAYILAVCPFLVYAWDHPDEEREHINSWLLWTGAICLTTLALPFERADGWDCFDPLCLPRRPWKHGAVVDIP